VKVEDQKELAEAVIYMLDNRYNAHKMGMKARRIVKEKCEMNEVAIKYIYAYKKILFSCSK
jgi:hypothetical protein